jgi:DNA processing protein
MNDLRLCTAWIASIPSMSVKYADLLRAHFSSLHTVYTASLSQLLEVGLPSPVCSRIIRHRQDHPIEELERAIQTHNVRILVPSDPEYPFLLHEIPDPPLVLYVQGTLPPSTMFPIAVVGTRQVTSYGEKVARELVTQLVDAGCLIISGFMYGVDAVAHTTALDCQGKTVGVLGFGFEHMYPKEHESLRQRMIASQNCLLSEFAPWQPPSKFTFPLRNRIVAGMSRGVVVIEAATKSGSKITARLAAEYGREVFAVPGPMDSPFAQGTKELVNLGAKLVTSATDILEEFMPLS